MAKGVNVKERIKNPVFRSRVIELYEKYGSITSVTFRADCSPQTVKKILVEEGVEIKKIPSSYTKACCLNKFAGVNSVDYNQRTSYFKENGVKI